MPDSPRQIGTRSAVRALRCELPRCARSDHQTRHKYSYFPSIDRPNCFAWAVPHVTNDLDAPWCHSHALPATTGLIGVAANQAPARENYRPLPAPASVTRRGISLTLSSSSLQASRAPIFLLSSPYSWIYYYYFWYFPRTEQHGERDCRRFWFCSQCWRRRLGARR